MIATENRNHPLTLTDLADRFGPMPCGRILPHPAPGTATQKDVLAMLRQRRLCELVDGVLVEKVMNFADSVLAADIGASLSAFVQSPRLGVVAGAGGPLRLAKGLVRIPDVSFVSRSRLPGGKVPHEPIPDLVPDLAVEVLSEGNTEQEMARKLRDYFDSGVELVWFFDPRKRRVDVFTAPDERRVLKGSQMLTGGTVLRGFKVRVEEVFSVLDEV
jgi:Uma2 family endonuclease